MPSLWRSAFWVVTTVVLVAFIAHDSTPKLDGLVSFGGLLFFVSMLLAFSRCPQRVPWNLVLSCFLIQYLIALIVLRWELGLGVLACLADRAHQLVSFSDLGSRYLLGYLVTGEFVGVDEVMPPIFTFTVCSQGTGLHSRILTENADMLETIRMRHL